MTQITSMKPLSRRCTATKLDGTPCNAWAVRGSDPPLCGMHGGRPPASGSRAAAAIPDRSRGRRTAPDDAVAAGAGDIPAPDLTDVARIRAVILDLAAKQSALSDYIDAHLEDPDADLPALARLFALHGQNASRLGRLLRDQRALSGAAADGIAGAIAQALDELGNELGADL
jgi:hypothetical protein